MRVVDTESLMRDYRSALADGAELPLVVSGGSMRPFLAPGRDTVYLRAPDRPLRRGDIAFYRRADGQYVLHRICRARGGQFWFVGDAQDVREGPLPASPLNRGEPFWIMAILPLFASLARPFSTKSC